ncbi:MAG: SAM-dependent methyltransferase [Alphaproteobacteria bacterium PRO2]|nr:SAM-dependent methyltransferase [Alphaproteobacteria bacterium PRO2]
MEEILKNLIREKGPIDVAEFMGLALGHPAHGYYMKGDPFGARGDFTTAPEISQMFGEMIAAWIMDVWQQMGSPVFTLLECGPGRGTLMADIMRSTKNVPGFHDSVEIHLLEISPALREMQAQSLAPYCLARPLPSQRAGCGGHPAKKDQTPAYAGETNGGTGETKVFWHANLQELPDRPIIVIANEFLDALPVRQLVRGADAWKERVVNVQNDKFVYATKELPFNLDVAAAEGEIFEISPVRSQFVMDLVKKMNRCGTGAALIIDYGHTQPGLGDTLQALKNHQYVSPLEDVGDADLTTHVDFYAAAQSAKAEGAEVFGPVEQGAFLKTIGIEQRTEILKGRATPAQKFDIEKALQRLVDSSQMGSLFKVMGLTNGQNISLPGF